MGENGTAIKIQLTEDVCIVAEIDTSAHVLPYKEIYIGIEKDGTWHQTLAVAREAYHYDNAGLPVPDHGLYEILVYENGDDDDYSQKFVINGVEEEL